MTDTSNDNQPLIMAYAGSMEYLVPFLKSGGPVSYADRKGNTLLHAAADGWQHEMVKFLIIWGANVNAQNNEGETPLHCLASRCEIPGFQEQNPDSSTARTETFSELLLRGADARLRNKYGATPLHVAAYVGNLPAVNMLAPHSEVDALVPKGATALALSVVKDHVECARRLLQFGACPSIKLPNSAGLDPCSILDLMRSSSSPQMRELAKSL